MLKNRICSLMGNRGPHELSVTIVKSLEIIPPYSCNATRHITSTRQVKSEDKIRPAWGGEYNTTFQKTDRQIFYNLFIIDTWNKKKSRGQLFENNHALSLKSPSQQDDDSTRGDRGSETRSVAHRSGSSRLNSILSGVVFSGHWGRGLSTFIFEGKFLVVQKNRSVIYRYKHIQYCTYRLSSSSLKYFSATCHYYWLYLWLISLMIAFY